MGAIENRKILFFDSYNDFGSLYSHYAKRSQDGTPLMPVLSVEWIKEEKLHRYILTPGFLDTEENFHSCPVLIFYCQLIKYIQEEDFSGDFPFQQTVHFSFKLFSVDFKEFKRFNMKFTTHDTIRLDWGVFDKVINLLNLYIKRGYSIHNLNIEGLNFDDFTLNDDRILINIVNQMDFVFYEDCRIKVGDDNRFWDEAEVNNIPNDQYLKNIIFFCLKKQCRKISELEDGYLMTFEIEFAWAPSHSRRRKDEDQTQRINEIKDFLKIDLAKVYDRYDHLFSKISINFKALNIDNL